MFMFKSTVSLGFIYAVSCALALIPRGSYDYIEVMLPSLYTTNMVLIHFDNVASLLSV